MTTDELDNLKRIKDWLNEVLDKADGLSGALSNAGLNLGSDIVENAKKQLELVYVELDEKIENTTVITEPETKVILTDSFINRRD